LGSKNVVRTSRDAASIRNRQEGAKQVAVQFIHL
jgi:hypothetical protein